MAEAPANTAPEAPVRPTESDTRKWTDGNWDWWNMRLLERMWGLPADTLSGELTAEEQSALRVSLGLLKKWGRDFESSAYKWNPLNTTMEGGQVGPENSAGVQSYESLEAGLDATARTLGLSYYQNLGRFLRNPHGYPRDNASALALMGDLLTWVSGTDKTKWAKGREEDAGWLNMADTVMGQLGFTIKADAGVQPNLVPIQGWTPEQGAGAAPGGGTVAPAAGEDGQAGGVDLAALYQQAIQNFAYWEDQMARMNAGQPTNHEQWEIIQRHEIARQSMNALRLAQPSSAGGLTQAELDLRRDDLTLKQNVAIENARQSRTRRVDEAARGQMDAIAARNEAIGQARQQNAGDDLQRFYDPIMAGNYEAIRESWRERIPETMWPVGEDDTPTGFTTSFDPADPARTRPMGQSPYDYSGGDTASGASAVPPADRHHFRGTEPWPWADQGRFGTDVSWLEPPGYTPGAAPPAAAPAPQTTFPGGGVQYGEMLPMPSMGVAPSPNNNEILDWLGFHGSSGLR